MKLSRPHLSARLRLALSLAATLALAGCGSKSSGVSGPGSSTATLNGFVTLSGTAGTPVEGAVVKSTNGDSTLTNAGGQFSLHLPSGQDVRVDVTKTNYTLNQLHVSLFPGESRAVTVGLMAAGNTAPVVVSSGGSVTDPSSNAKITLPPFFVAGSGPVSVTITGLDPTTDQITALPGGLTAIDGTGATKFLKPVSFAEYTVKDASGNVLQFNSSASSGANIELPIPASLRGQPGYQNGDPIECYVYDPADGKWKTPVPGTIGPSSVDGQPAIKATIFHLSWYGGAPATSDIACVSGTVRDSLGNALAGVNVEAFQGGRGTTDASGHYQIDAAAHSSVRIVTSRLVGGVFQTASDTVQTGGPADACITANLVLKTRKPTFTVNANIGDMYDPAGNVLSAIAQITIGDEATGQPVSGADVQVGTGGTFFPLPEISPGTGYYALFGGASGNPDFTPTPGAVYTLKVDFDHNGTFDAAGQVNMAGAPELITPVESSVQARTFTATWTDAGAGGPGYVPHYIGFNSKTVAGNEDLQTAFITSSDSYVIGSGVADPVMGFPNAFLTSGGFYTLTMTNAVGPYGSASALPGISTAPNVTGGGATGYFYSYSGGAANNYTSTGVSGPALAHSTAPAAVAPGSARRFATLFDQRVKPRLSLVRTLDAYEKYARDRRFNRRAAK